MTFLEFINKKKINESILQKVNESYNAGDTKKVIELLGKSIKRGISLDLYYTSNMYEIVNTGGTSCIGYRFIVGDGSGRNFRLNFSIDNNLVFHSVDFFANLDEMFNGKGTSDLSLYAPNASAAILVPIIIEIINTNSFSISDTDNELLMANESKYDTYNHYVGALKYEIMQNVDSNVIKEAEDLKQRRRILKNELYTLGRSEGKNSDKYQELKNELESVEDLINGGNGKIKNKPASIKNRAPKVIVKKRVNSKTIEPESTKEQDKEIESKTSPEMRFQELEKYVEMVLKGIQPSLILCGAPGLGKSYRVNKLVKAAGYVEDINLCTVKGGVTPAELYKLMYKFQDENNLFIVDDADSIIKPGAKDDGINLLKAALDSSDERIVTWRVAKKILDDEGQEIPKSFIFKGKMIVITNYSAGQIDTAIRNRAFVQSLDFDVKEVLQLIKGIMPYIQNNTGTLTAKAKQEALDYLYELVNEEPDAKISVRTFTTVAKILSIVSDDKEMAFRMIKEQIINQTLKGGKKF